MPAPTPARPSAPAAPGPVPVPSVASQPPRPRPAVAVLLAEHEPEVAELARRYLTRAGAAVTITAGADETTAALTARIADVAVLDLTMPGLDARRLRRLLTDLSRTTPPSRNPQQPQSHQSPQNDQKSHSHQETRRHQESQGPEATQNAPPSRLPTLFLLSASMRPRDLRIAAEACLWRPFSPRLLVSRVLAIVPRPAPPATLAATGPAASRPTATGPTADPSRPGHLVRTPVSTAPLTPAESALLAALATHPGHVLSRSRLQAILGRSTPGHPASGRAIDVHVSQLRAKLPDPRVLRTVRGVGYILDDPEQSAPDTPGR